MKKKLFVLFLILLIFSLAATGTLSVFNININDTNNMVSAKKFIVNGGSDLQSEIYTKELFVLPQATAEWKFYIENYKGDEISEIPIDLNITVNIKNSLASSVKYQIISEDSKIISSGSYNGEITFQDSFELSEIGQTKSYTVKISNNSNYIKASLAAGIEANQNTDSQGGYKTKLGVFEIIDDNRFIIDDMTQIQENAQTICEAFTAYYNEIFLKDCPHPDFSSNFSINKNTTRFNCPDCHEYHNIAVDFKTWLNSSEVNAAVNNSKFSYTIYLQKLGTGNYRVLKVQFKYNNKTTTYTNPN